MQLIYVLFDEHLLFLISIMLSIVKNGQHKLLPQDLPGVTELFGNL